MRQLVEITAETAPGAGGKPFVCCPSAVRCSSDWINVVNKCIVRAIRCTVIATICAIVAVLSGCQVASRSFRPADVASVIPDGVAPKGKTVLKPQSKVALASTSKDSRKTTPGRVASASGTTTLLGSDAVVRGQSQHYGRRLDHA